MSRSLRSLVLAPAGNLLSPPTFKQAAIRLPRARSPRKPPLPMAGPPTATLSKLKSNIPPKVVPPAPLREPLSSDMADYASAVRPTAPTAAAATAPRTSIPKTPRRPVVPEPAPAPTPAPTPAKPWISPQNADRAMVGAAYALPTAGVAGLYAMSGDGKGGPPEASAAPAASAAPTPAPAAPKMPGVGIKDMLPKGMQEGAGAVMDHMGNYWPAYAAGGLGLLALTNALRRRRRRPTAMQKYSADFAKEHPQVAEFFAKCAHLKLSNTQIESRIHTLALVDDDIRTRFDLAFRHDFFKQSADGFLTNAGNQWGRFVNGTVAAGAGGLSTIGTGIAAGGVNGWNASTPKSWNFSPENTASVNTAFNDSGALARAGATDVWNSAAAPVAQSISPRWMSDQADANPYNREVDKLFADVRNREGVTDGVRTVSNVAGGGSTVAAEGALALASAPKAIAQAPSWMSKLPGAQQTATAVQAANKPLVPQVAGGARQLLQKSKDFGNAMRANPVATTAGALGAAEGVQATVNSATPPVVDAYGRPLGETHLPVSATGAIDRFVSQPYQQGVYDDADAAQQQSVQQIASPVADGQPPPNQGDAATNPLPGEALPGSEGATTNPAMAAEPQPAVSPGADAPAAGGQPGSPGQPGAPAAPGVDDKQLQQVAQDPAVPVETKQQMAGAATEDALNRLAQESGMNPDQAKQYVGRMVQEGLTPEEHQVGMERFGKAMMEQNPGAGNDPGFMDQITQSWNGMDAGSKALMFIGGGLGLLGLVNALGEEGGVGDWLLALLGIGTAAGVAGGAGMFGQDAQKMIGGVGNQLMGLLPGGQPQSKLPPLTPSAAPPNPASAPPAAGQNPNIPGAAAPPAGAPPAAAPPAAAPDLNALSQANPWLNQFAGGGTDPKALDPGDAENVIGDWVRTRLGGLATMGRQVGPVDDKQITGLIASLQSQPALQQQVAAGIQAKLQDPQTPAVAKPHLEQLLQQLAPKT